jgi:hypothetical protein
MTTHYGAILCFQRGTTQTFDKAAATSIEELKRKVSEMQREEKANYIAYLKTVEMANGEMITTSNLDIENL